MPILVSILIPAYNAENWISGAIKSAQDQTWPNKEIIVVDDGSRDRTLQIANRHESRITKIFSQQNSGASSARNKALSMAQGEYIQWLDADDMLASDKIEKQLKGEYADPNARILFSSAWGKFFFRLDRTKFVPNSLWQNLNPSDWLFKKIDENAWMAIESWLVSRHLTNLAGPWNENLSLDDDGEYFCRVVAKSDKVIFVPEAKTYCRIGHVGSLSTRAKYSNRKLDSQFISICLQIQYLLSLDDCEKTRSICLKYLQMYLINFYPERADIIKKANVLARELGGKLSAPKMKKEFNFIRKIFGWKAAKDIQQTVAAAKSYAARNWDRLV